MERRGFPVRGHWRAASALAGLASVTASAEPAGPSTGASASEAFESLDTIYGGAEQFAALLMR